MLAGQVEGSDGPHAAAWVNAHRRELTLADVEPELEDGVRAADEAGLTGAVQAEGAAAVQALQWLDPGPAQACDPTRHEL